MISDIQEQIPLILRIILLAVENKDCHKEIISCQNLDVVGSKNLDMSQ